MNWVLQQHFSAITATLGSMQYSLIRQAHQHLDGLRIGGAKSLKLAKKIIDTGSDDEDDYIPATIIAIELGEKEDIDNAVELLLQDSDDIRNACRIGLRFGDIRRCETQLRKIASSQDQSLAIAAADVLAFHRYPIRLQHEINLPSENAIAKSLFWEAAGRTRESFGIKKIEAPNSAVSPRVRAARLRAACRKGISNLHEICRKEAEIGDCIESIIFFGLLSKISDCNLLQKLLMNPTITVAALSAIGKSGWIRLVPSLLDFLDSEDYSQPATLAFERITGLTVPRGEPIEPPEDLDEDEKDLWVTAGLPETNIIREWWQENSGIFDEQHRYQEGHCVSKDPLPVIANQLSPRVALDVYLRERALNHKNTPDWELETWPRYWQNPGWTFS